MAEKALKQTTFVWEGLDKRGERVRGEVAGASANLVRANLRRQGINPRKIKKKGEPLFGGKRKVRAKDIAVFSRQLATMMSSGVPLVQSFEIIGRGHENKGVQDLLLSVKNDIEGGSNLSDALARHPLHFDDLYCNLVRAGEHAGILDSLLDKIATYKEKTEAIKGKIKKAMFYPTAVIIVALIITAVLMIFVIPQFAELFSGFGADLPAPTRIVIAMSEFVQTWWWLIGAIIIGSVWGTIQFHKRSRKFQQFMDRLVLKIPILGPVLRTIAVGRFARTLGALTAGGITILEALGVVRDTLGNELLAREIDRVAEQVKRGEALADPLAESGYFPPLLVQIVAIGEQTGKLDELLLNAAETFDADADAAIKRFMDIFPALLILILAVVIGFILAAALLPIVQMSLNAGAM